MKRKITLLLLTLTFLSINKIYSQSDFYVTTGGEMIFSFAPDIDNNGMPGQSIMRWSPWFNFQSYGNIDFNNYMGALLGISIRNVGFIDDMPDVNNTQLKKKYRTYNFGIPVGLKLGIMKRYFVFGGYEIEFPFHYKEKTFINNDKIDTKITGWFSGRTECCMHTVFAGIQLPHGMSVKFKYYLTNFFNEDYTEVIDGNTVRPYEGKKVNIMYISLSFSLFKNTRFETPVNNKIY